jgi:hypothetical protein
MIPNLDRPTIHYTKLSPAPADDPAGVDWNAYLANLPRLLAEGCEGKTVLIKDGEVIGVFDSWDEAAGEGYRRYPRQQFFAKQLRENEPLYRIRR